jgi:hypothetical protein
VGGCEPAAESSDDHWLAAPCSRKVEVEDGGIKDKIAVSSAGVTCC